MKNLVQELAKTSKFFTKIVKAKYPAFYQHVLDNFPGSKPVEKFWNFVHDNLEIPKCEYCKTNDVPFGKSFSQGYQRHCSQSCSQFNNKTREKIKSTNLKTYGVEHNMQSSKCKELRQNTWLKKLGVDNPAKNKTCNDKAIKTKREIYGHANGYIFYAQNQGVENSMHIPQIAEKVLLSQKKTKTYVLPSGDVAHIQGYEQFALNILLQKYNERFISVHKNVPCIRYEFNGQSKIHYPDIFISSENLLIEVKSGYTLNADYDKNYAKQKAALSQGYRYEFWTFDRSETELQIYSTLDQMKLQHNN